MVHQLEKEVDALKQRLHDYNREQLSLRVASKALDEKSEETLRKLLCSNKGRLYSWDSRFCLLFPFPTFHPDPRCLFSRRRRPPPRPPFPSSLSLSLSPDLVACRPGQAPLDGRAARCRGHEATAQRAAGATASLGCGKRVRPDGGRPRAQHVPSGPPCGHRRRNLHSLRSTTRNCSG
ncbi:uncharacterized protein [Miscanthus floridulus]|uniref:uncharacterized protein isoform X2 n=1 Tax=Miscanthus floridulus TaxID=154761 RepID=UPI003459142B